MRSRTGLAKPTLFISASRDMRPEAEIVARLVEDLSQEHPALRDLQSFQWFESDTPWRGDATWQEQIPSPADPMVVAVVCLFGARLGEPLPADFPLDNLRLPPEVQFPWREDGPGRIPLTGTLYEYLVARHGAESVSADRPRAPLLVYALADPADAVSNLPADQRNWGLGRHFNAVCRGQRRDELAEYFRQVDWLTVFFDRVHRPSERPCGFFDADPDAFRRQVAGDLLRHFSLDTATARIETLKGLAAYDVQDRAIFAGRGRFLGKVMKDIRHHPSDEPLAAIILGASGAGKSSVLRAGIAGELMAQRAGQGRRYRVLLATPRQLMEEGPAPAIGKLLAQTALPELGRPDDLAAALAGDADAAAERLVGRIVEALHTAERSAETDAAHREQPRLKLVIALDQLDELVGDVPDAPTSETVRTLLGLLVAGVRQGAFWLIGSLADVRLAGWNRLLGRDAGMFDLLHLGNPNWEELDEIIDVSFRALGVSLPVDLKQGLLASCLGIDRAGSATLPLLSMAMTRLGGAMRKVAAAPGPGGSPNGTVGAASAHRAAAAPSLVRLTRLANVGAAINELGEQAMAAAIATSGASAPDLGPLLSRLVAVSPGSSRDLVTLLPHTPSADQRDRFGAIIEELTARRLLAPADEGRIQFAHEAVIRHWDRARTWFETARKHLVFLETIRPMADKWEAAQPDRKPAFLLPPGYCLEAHSLLTEWSGEAEHLPLDFLRASFIAHAGDLIEHVHTDGRTSLAVAVQRGDLALVQAYIAAGADVGRGGPQGLTALHYVRERRICEMLLSAPGVQIDARSEFGESALDRAAVHRRWDVALTLLEAGASPNGPLSPYDPVSESDDPHGSAGALKSVALAAAAGAGEIAGVQALLARGAVVAGPGSTALTNACRGGHFDIAAVLLDAGADPVAAGEKADNAPLGCAVRSGNFDLVDLLLARGAARNRIALDAALVAAAHGGQTTIIGRLIEAGASVHAVDEPMARPALAHAVREGRHAAVDALINAGADPRWRDAAGRTLLHASAEIGDLPLVHTFASLLGALEPQDGNGATPLHAACRANRVEVVRHLLDTGADPGRTDMFGFDALAMATYSGADDVVDILLAHGVAAGRAGPGGMTAVQIAAARGATTTFDRLSGVSAAGSAPARQGPPLLVSAAHTLNGEMIDRLIGLGFPVDERDALGLTALMHACWTGDADIVEALLQAGADPGAVGPQGWTPLMFAAAVPGVEDETVERIVLELLAVGADLAARNDAGQAAGDIADIHGGHVRAMILRSLGPPEGHDFLSAGARR